MTFDYKNIEGFDDRKVWSILVCHDLVPSGSLWVYVMWRYNYHVTVSLTDSCEAFMRKTIFNPKLVTFWILLLLAWGCLFNKRWSIIFRTNHNSSGLISYPEQGDLPGSHRHYIRKLMLVWNFHLTCISKWIELHFFSSEIDVHELHKFVTEMWRGLVAT